jgi:hypothetical protein
VAVQEDARTAARRIVEEVLASHGPQSTPGASPGSDGDGARPVPSDTDVSVVVDSPDVIVDLTVEARAAGTGPETTDERRRARALVAEVLEAHEARQAAAAAEADARARLEIEAAEARAHEEEVARRFAEALAEEESRAAAEAEARERARAEEAERALWSEADRGVASETVQMARQDDEAEQPVEATTPLDVAELAAAERAASRRSGDDPDEGARDDGAGPERTMVLPTAGDPTRRSDLDATQLVAVPEGGATAIAAPAEEVPAAESLESTSAPALEAIVDPADVGERPRTGRWFLASIVGAVTLAILFPLAINALMDLVAMS